MCVESLFVYLLHSCDTNTLSFIALNHLEAHGVGEALWLGLVRVLRWKPPELVTTTADVLDELGLKEKATQLRGWLVCQSLAGFHAFTSNCLDIFEIWTA